MKCATSRSPDPRNANRLKLETRLAKLVSVMGEDGIEAASVSFRPGVPDPGPARAELRSISIRGCYTIGGYPINKALPKLFV